MKTECLLTKCRVPGCRCDRRESKIPFIGNLCYWCWNFFRGIPEIGAYSQAAKNYEERLKRREIEFRKQTLSEILNKIGHPDVLL